MKTLFNPSAYVRQFFESLGVKKCQFCVYKYDRRVKTMRRRFVESTVESMESSFEQLENGLSAGEEVALDSRCKKARSNRVWHLAMLDWRAHSKYPLRHARELASLIGAPEFLIVASGRSYHIYFKKLLSQVDFRLFLTRSILAEDSETGVDYRWVAHRLLDGFATLRWSGHSWRHSLEPQVLVCRKHTTATKGSRSRANAKKQQLPEAHAAERLGSATAQVDELESTADRLLHLASLFRSREESQ